MIQPKIIDFLIKKPKFTRTIWDHETGMCRGKVTFNMWFFKKNFNERHSDSFCEFKSTINYMKTSVKYFLKEFMKKKQQEIRFHLSLAYSFKLNKYSFKDQKKCGHNCKSCKSCLHETGCGSRWIISNEIGIMEHFGEFYEKAIKSLQDSFNEQLKVLKYPFVQISGISLWYKTTADHNDIKYSKDA